MIREAKYPVFVALIFTGSITLLLVLFKKYTSLTLAHFTDGCRWLASTFFSSGVHYVGFFVLLSISSTTVVFMAKASFSLIKTQKKIKRLLADQTDLLPQKLLPLLQLPKLNKVEIIVINRRSRQVFGFGLFSSKLLISKGLINTLSARELEAVILHELYHLNHRHVVILFAGEVIASTLFFLPIVADLVHQMRLVFEQEADAFAVSKQQTDAYLRLALAKTLTGNHRYQPYPAFAAGILEQRVAYLLGQRRPQGKRPTGRLVSSIGAVLLGTLLLLLPTRSHVPTAAVQAAPETCRQTWCPVRCSDQEWSGSRSGRFSSPDRCHSHLGC